MSVDTGVKVRGKPVFRGPRGGLHYITPTGKKARLDQYDVREFERRVRSRAQNSNKLTGLPPDLIARIARNLSNANTAALAQTTQASARALADSLSDRKSDVKNAWKKLLLAPVLQPRTEPLRLGQTVGPLTVISEHVDRFDADPHTLLEGGSIIGRKRYRVRAHVLKTHYEGDDGRYTGYVILNVHRYFVMKVTNLNGRVHEHRGFEHVVSIHADKGKIWKVYVKPGNSATVVKQAAQELGIAPSAISALYD